VRTKGPHALGKGSGSAWRPQREKGVAGPYSISREGEHGQSGRKKKDFAGFSWGRKRNIADTKSRKDVVKEGEERGIEKRESGGRHGVGSNEELCAPTGRLAI